MGVGVEARALLEHRDEMSADMSMEQMDTLVPPSGGAWWLTVDQKPATEKEESEMGKGEFNWKPRGLLKWKEGMVVAI